MSPSGDARLPSAGAPDPRILYEDRLPGGLIGPRTPAEWTTPEPPADSGDNGGVDPRRSFGLPSLGQLSFGRRGLAAVAGATLIALAAAPVALAHGGVVPPEPTPAAFLLAWQFDPLVWLPAIFVLVLWRALVAQANRAHPDGHVARRRTVSFVLGVCAIVAALDSGIAAYDTTLFSVHMVQHLVLTLVAPPLLLAGGPITLLLQASSHETRVRWILPVLHARVVRFLSFPVVSWLLFAGVMWMSHFSPLFNASLEDPMVHRLEHALFLAAALLFWWPVVGPDPSPWGLPPAAKVAYAFLQMPQNTFLAVAIWMSATPLYPHYVTTIRSWGPSVMEDQATAGGIMWLGGDFAFLAAVILLMRAWINDDERRTVGEDRRLEPERAAIREREVRLAARRVAGSGAGAGPVTASAAGAAAGPGPSPTPGQASGGTGDPR